MKRIISVGLLDNKAYLILWYDTEDEESFPVRCLKRGRPYVLAYGTKYYLTNEEIRDIKNTINNLNRINVSSILPNLPN